MNQLKKCDKVVSDVIFRPTSREFVGCFVRLSVRWFLAFIVMSKSASMIFTTFGTDVQHMSLLTFWRSRSTYKGHMFRVRPTIYSEDET